MKRKQKPQRSKWGLDTHRRCKHFKKKILAQFEKDIEELLDDYKHEEGEP